MINLFLTISGVIFHVRQLCMCKLQVHVCVNIIILCINISCIKGTRITTKMKLEKGNTVILRNTRLKPVEHGYVFSMAVVTIGEWLKLVRGRTVDWGGGGGFLK